MADLIAASVLLAVATTVVLALYGASLAFAADRRPVVVEPFLSGHPLTEHAVSRYHARWYAVTIVFLAFDMEMAFMFPWALVVTEMGAAAVVEMFGFLGVLLVGVAARRPSTNADQRREQGPLARSARSAGRRD